MKVIFTDGFKRKLLKLGNIDINEIVLLISKYPYTNNIFSIDKVDSSKILKGYLFSKKVRILVLFKYTKGIFIPMGII